MGNCGSSNSDLELMSSDMLTSSPNFKVLIIGDSKVGKTSIVDRYSSNRYSSNYSKTEKLKIASVDKVVNIPQHTLVSLTLWDTPGTDDIDLKNTYFSQVDAVIVVVDVTNKDSVAAAGFWRQQAVNSLIQSNGMSTQEAYRLPAILLANKFDIIDKDRVGDAGDRCGLDDVSFSDPKTDLSGGEKWQLEYVEEISRVVRENRFLTGLLVSAKEPDGSIHQAMQTLIRHLVEKHLELTYGVARAKKLKIKSKLVDPNEEQYLAQTSVDEIDTVVTQCSRVVQRINDLHSAYSTTLTKFKVACADAEVIPADTCHKASLEQCVYALKMSVADIGQLVAEEQSEGLVQLSIQEKMIPAGELSHALERFNQSYAAVCATVIGSSSGLISSLTDLDREMLQSYNDYMAQSDNNASDEESPVAHEAVTEAVQKNRVQIGESLLTIRELELDAQRARDKVHASLMW